MSTRPFLACLAALAVLSALPAFTPAAADAVDAPVGAPAVPELPGFGPETRGPLTGIWKGGPAAVMFIPPGQSVGPVVPGIGILTLRPGYSPDWEVHVAGLVYKCITTIHKGSIHVEGIGAVVASNRYCTGRFTSEYVYEVTTNEQSYAGVTVRMAGTIVAAPMPI